MATTSSSIVDNKVENPISGDTGIFVFIIIVLLSTVIALISCSDIVDWSDWIKELIIQIYCLIIALGWFSFTGSDNSDDFFWGILIFGIVFGVIVAMILSTYTVFFWLALLTITSSSIFALLYEISQQKRKEAKAWEAKRKNEWQVEQKKRKDWDEEYKEKKLNLTGKIDLAERREESKRLSEQREAENKRRISWDGLYTWRKNKSPKLDILDWDTFSSCLYITWIVSGLFITLGRTSYLPYASPISAISQIHLLLDLRVLITALLLLLLIGKAVVEAFDEGVPEVLALPQFKLPGVEKGTNDIIVKIIQPFIIVTNAILLVIQKITNSIWHVVAMVGIYLYRIGSILADDVIVLVFKDKVWLVVFRVLVTFIAVLVLTLLIKYIAPSIIFYLTSNTSIFSIQLMHLQTIIQLIGIFAVTLFLIVIVCWIWEFAEKPLGKAAFAGSTLIISWCLASIIMHLIVLSSLFNIRGFDTLGIYTLSIILLITSVFIFQVIKRLSKGKIRY